MSACSTMCLAPCLSHLSVRNLIFSLAMILIMLFKPAGLWPSPEKNDGLTCSSPLKALNKNNRWRHRAR